MGVAFGDGNLEISDVSDPFIPDQDAKDYEDPDEEYN